MVLSNGNWNPLKLLEIMGGLFLLLPWDCGILLSWKKGQSDTQIKTVGSLWISLKKNTASCFCFSVRWEHFGFFWMKWHYIYLILTCTLSWTCFDGKVANKLSRLIKNPFFFRPFSTYCLGQYIGRLWEELGKRRLSGVLNRVRSEAIVPLSVPPDWPSFKESFGGPYHGYRTGEIREPRHNGAPTWASTPPASPSWT